MAEAGSLTCPTCGATLSPAPRARSKCRACNSWIYPSFKSVFHSTLLTESQHTVAKARDSFEWALRRSAEAKLDRRMLEATLLRSYAGGTATEEDVVLTVSPSPRHGRVASFLTAAAEVQ